MDAVTFWSCSGSIAYMQDVYFITTLLRVDSTPFLDFLFSFQNYKPVVLYQIITQLAG